MKNSKSTAKKPQSPTSNANIAPYSMKGPGPAIHGNQYGAANAPMMPPYPGSIKGGNHMPGMPGGTPGMQGGFPGMHGGYPTQGGPQPCCGPGMGMGNVHNMMSPIPAGVGKQGPTPMGNGPNSFMPQNNMPVGGISGTQNPVMGNQESYIENILRLNLGKHVTIYMTFENNTDWNAKTFKGKLQAAGRDHIIISDPQTGKRYLLLMIYLDYITFDEPIEYAYPYHTGVSE